MQISNLCLLHPPNLSVAEKRDLIWFLTMDQYQLILVLYTLTLFILDDVVILMRNFAKEKLSQHAQNAEITIFPCLVI